MKFKYPRNVVIGAIAVTALMAATVLFGGFANTKPAVNDSEAPAIACQASGSCCPAMAQTTSFQAMAAAQSESTDASNTAFAEDCPKPCCAKAAGQCPDNPCPKPCCGDDAPKGCCGASE